MEDTGAKDQGQVIHPEEALIEEESTFPLSGGAIISSNKGFKWLSMPFHNRKLPQPDSESHRPYVYEALPPGHVRFLAKKVQPDSELLAFEFLSMPLESAKDKYVAISYCWGHGSSTDFILADGSSVPATEKVKDHLVYLNSRTSNGLFCPPEPDKSMIWIDSLCINQADEVEKTQQIQLMGQIYHGAITVEILLDSGKASLDVITESFLSRSLTGNVAHHFNEPLGWLIAPFSKRAIREMMWSPWFTRAWVVQEFCFARNYRFHYKGILLNLRFLLEIYDYGREHGYIYVYTRDGRSEAIIPPMVENFPEILTHRGELQRHLKDPERSRNPDSGYGFPLEDVLCSFFSLKTSDPRDKIFAMLNLVTGKCPVTANYEHEAPAVYFDTTISVLGSGTDFALLGFAGLAARKPLFGDPPGLPSWVPDFSTPPLHRTWSDKYKYFNASGASNISCVKTFISVLVPPAQIPSDDEELRAKVHPCPYIDTPTFTLSVMAIRIGHVTAIAKGKIESSLEHRRVFFPEARRLVQSLPPDSKTAVYPNALAETLIAGNQEFMERPDSKLHLNEVTKTLEMIDQELPPLGTTLPKPYINALMTEGAGRTRGVFTTDTNHLGLTANEVEPGDEVWLFLGARVPFILRGPHWPVLEEPVSKQVFAYELVCEAYVHGIMKGELELDWDEADLVTLL